MGGEVRSLLHKTKRKRKAPSRKRAKVFPKATDEQIACVVLTLANSGHFRTTDKIARALGLTEADMKELTRAGVRHGLWKRGELMRILRSHREAQEALVKQEKQRLTSSYRLALSLRQNHIDRGTIGTFIQ